MPPGELKGHTTNDRRKCALRMRRALPCHRPRTGRSMHLLRAWSGRGCDNRELRSLAHYWPYMPYFRKLKAELAVCASL